MNGNKEKQLPGGQVSGKSSVDLNELSSILELLSSNDVTEFELKKGDMQLSLKRGKDFGQSTVSAGSSPQIIQFPYPNYPAPSYGGHSAPQQHSQLQNYAAPHGSAPTHAESAPASAAAAPKPVVELTPAKQLKEITSPIVGTFYRRPAVDAESYVDVGDVVKKGDVLCIVEAMKLMNEIEADVGGRIAEICIQDASMVEYGEVLFRIEPV